MRNMQHMYCENIVEMKCVLSWSSKLLSCGHHLYKVVTLTKTPFQISWLTMARGQQKIQSQQKAAEAAAKRKKAEGNSLKDQKKAAAAGLKMTCSVCRSMMPDPKTYKQVKVYGFRKNTRWREFAFMDWYFLLVCIIAVRRRWRRPRKSKEIWSLRSRFSVFEPTENVASAIAPNITVIKMFFNCSILRTSTRRTRCLKTW